MREHRVTSDGKYIEATYPIDEYEEGSECYRIVPSKPEDLLREYDAITTVDGITYGRGVVWADTSNHRKGGRGIVWRLA